jgi:hypothetical protein
MRVKHAGFYLPMPFDLHEQPVVSGLGKCIREMKSPQEARASTGAPSARQHLSAQASAMPSEQNRPDGCAQTPTNPISRTQHALRVADDTPGEQSPVTIISQSGFRP